MAQQQYVRYPSVEEQRKRQEELALKNKRLGMNIFQISWIMAFVALIVVNWQLRFTATTWPPPGVQPLQPFLPTVATFGLLVSFVLARRSVKAMEADDRRAFLIQWRAVLGLGVAFMAIMLFEWLTVPPVPTEMITLLGGAEVEAVVTQYNAVFRLMTGFHAFHALVIAFYMFRVMRVFEHGGYSSDDYWDIEAGAKLWYFVVVAWLMFYVVLYWI